jgi:hypothetical protein
VVDADPDDAMGEVIEDTETDVMLVRAGAKCFVLFFFCVFGSAGGHERFLGALTATISSEASVLISALMLFLTCV